MVHSKAVAATSEHFNALVSGDMMEAKTRRAELLDVKPEDFVRFLEYAYRRDYTVPPCTEDEGTFARPTEPEMNEAIPAVEEPAAEEPAMEETPAESAPGWDEFEVDEPAVEQTAEEEPAAEPEPEPSCRRTYGAYSRDFGVAGSKTKKVTQRLALRPRFQRHTYLSTGDPKANILNGFEPQSNSCSQQNFTQVFLAHARLYTFADMRLVHPLRALALHKIHKTLMDFQLYYGRVGDVIELARYAYENGSDRTTEGIIDDLRKLVVEYIACEVDIIGKSKEFARLLEEGGEFVSDFWKIVQKDIL